MMIGFLLVFTTLSVLTSGADSQHPDLSHVHALVTGGAGFIGSHLLLALAQGRCRHVQAVDSFDAEYSVAVKRERADRVWRETGFRVMQADACNATTLRKLLQKSKFTHLIHMVRHIDLNSTLNCLRRVLSAVDHTQRSKQLASRIDVLYVVSEKTANHSDFSGVLYRGVSTVQIISPTVYGPSDRPEQPLPTLAQRILFGQPINSSEWNSFQYIYINDLVDGILGAVAMRKDTPSRVEYIAQSGPAVSVSSVVSLMQKRLKSAAIVIGTEDDRGTGFVEPLNLAYDIVSKTSFADGLNLFLDSFILREKGLSPCMSECSYPAACFEDAWDAAALLSRALTERCLLVYYTVATQVNTSRLHPAPKESAGCNIAFLNVNSLLFKEVAAFSTKVYLNYSAWTIVPLKDLDSEFHKDTRKPSRLPKLNPAKFFAPSVRYALYGDTSIMLLETTQKILSLMFPQSGRESIFAAVRHPRVNTNTVFDEINNVQHAMEVRKSVTNYPMKIAEQKLAYESYMNKFQGLNFNNVFDGSLLLHDLQSPVAKEFRCHWYRNYMEWSDRDQLSGAFIIGYLSHQFNSKTTGRQAEWIAVGDHKNITQYIHILPRTDHASARNQKGLILRKSAKKFYAKKKFDYNIR